MSSWIPATPEQLKQIGPNARVGHHCTRHDTTFLIGEVCAHCVAKPAPRIDVSTHEENEHDLELAAREVVVHEIAKMCFRVGKELLAGTKIDCHSAAKIIDTGLKAIRLANDTRDRRAAREESRAKRDYHRRMMGLRKGN